MLPNTRQATQYTIVEAVSASELKNKVSTLLAAGWSIHGAHFLFGGKINQPMVIYEAGIGFLALVGESYVPPG